MIRSIALCVLLAFSTAVGAQAPPDPSLGPPPKPKPKPVPQAGDIPVLIAPTPIAGPDPDPAIKLHPKSIPTLSTNLYDLEKGKVDEALLAPNMIAAFRAHRESLRSYMESFGAFQELKYLGAVEPANPMIVGGQRVNAEEYESLHAKGKMRWRFVMGPDGKVARLVSIRRAGE